MQQIWKQINNMQAKHGKNEKNDMHISNGKK